jgi:hypothetical protein
VARRQREAAAGQEVRNLGRRIDLAVGVDLN